MHDLRQLAGQGLARDGAEALSVLTRTPVDAVVTDHHMAEMSGLEMAQEIRATGSGIPIVMLTGADHLDAKALKAGVTVLHPSGQWTSVGDALQTCWMAVADQQQPAPE